MTAPFANISLATNARDKKLFAQQLGENILACGFCGITDHSINPNLIDEVMHIFEAFFALPRNTKMIYCDRKLKGARGYTPMSIETPKDSTHPDFKEFWHVGREIAVNHEFAKWMHRNKEVYEIKNFQENTNALFTQFDELGQTLLEAIAIFLDLNEDYFVTHAGQGNSLMRAIHYPPIKENNSAERAGPHEDINLITLLLGGHQRGLELLNKQGHWEKIAVSRDVVICNIGDMLQRFTNHYLPSTTHRVAKSGSNTTKSRYSIPFFVHPNPDWQIKTLASCISDDRPDRYPEPIMAEDFLEQRRKEIKLA